MVVDIAGSRLDVPVDCNTVDSVRLVDWNNLDSDRYLDSMRCMDLHLDCMVAGTNLKSDIGSVVIPDILVVDQAGCTHFRCMGDSVHRAVAVAVVEAVAVAVAADIVSVAVVVESDRHTGTHLVQEVFLLLYLPSEQL